jgi:hypothetical protein
MPNQKLKFAFSLIVTVILTLGFSISFQNLLAATWQEPGVAPPNSNIFPPVYNEHTTPASQVLINKPTGVAGNLSVSGGNLIIGAGGNIGVGVLSPTARLEFPDPDNDPSGAAYKVTTVGWRRDIMAHTIVFPLSTPSTTRGGGNHYFFLGAPSGDGNGDMYFGRTISINGTTPPLYSARIDGANGQWNFLGNTPRVCNAVGNNCVDIGGGGGGSSQWSTNNNDISNNNSGNVGIGTTNPTQKLDVAGQIRATDVCTTGGKCLSTVGGGSLSCTTVNATGVLSATADCGSNGTVIGGACHFSYNFAIQGNIPGLANWNTGGTISGNGYKCDFAETYGSFANFGIDSTTAQARCCTGGGSSTSSCTPISKVFSCTSPAQATLDCPAGSHVVGGGGYCGGCAMYQSSPLNSTSWRLYCEPGCSGGCHINAVCCTD